MNDARKKMLDRIKAILAKTMANGCTEGEAMAALAKAKELMAAYNIDEKEIEEAQKESININKTAEADPYDIKRNLYPSVATFTQCVGWGGKTSPITFAGRESDVIFATWLLDTLQRFVMRALRDHQKKLITEKGANFSNRLTSASFVTGCTTRIKEKLKELSIVMPAKEKAVILAEMEKQGIKLRKYSYSVEAHAASVAAGMKAGDNATFNRPVNAGGRMMLK